MPKGRAFVYHLPARFLPAPAGGPIVVYLPKGSRGPNRVRHDAMMGARQRGCSRSACNTVMWRGLSRLTDIELGATVGAKIVGN
jgi:hypothetical protein